MDIFMSITEKIARILYLISTMKLESDAYYGDDRPIVSDRTYDQQFDELTQLEQETGVIFPNSPTQIVSGAVLDSLNKVRHIRPMLSANKTKSITTLCEFAKKALPLENSNVMVSWKEDGLTLVLRYFNGHLMQAITRGTDGIVGEDVTHTVKTFQNVPVHIPCLDEVEIRGEGVISWKSFTEINESLLEPYSHPRNLAAGSVRQLDSNIARNRKLEFIAFELILPQTSTKHEQFEMMSAFGFHVVEHRLCSPHELQSVIGTFIPERYDYPVDGIIVEYDDSVYGHSLGATGHHENLRMALKWADDTIETTFRGVELQTTRTGRISLVALFDTVVLDRTKVSRATLHNYSYFQSLHLGVGDTITVYKANKIIPAIDDNLTRSGTYQLPDTCPCCGIPTKLVSPNESLFLYCQNAACPARRIKQFEHFVTQDGANIVGLSTSTLEKLVDTGYVKHYADIYHTKEYAEYLKKIDGLGAKSIKKLLGAIENSRSLPLSNLLISIGIPLLGKSSCRTIEKYFNGNLESFCSALRTSFDFTVLTDFGETMSASIYRFFSDPANLLEWNLLLEEITVMPPVIDYDDTAQSLFKNKRVVVTGTLKNYSRESINIRLLELGATPSGAVSKKTDYVIVGEKPGSKAEKANQLGIPVITEEEFETMMSSPN